MSTPLLPSGNSAYYYPQTRGSQTAYQPSQTGTAVKSLEQLKQEVGSGVLNASRMSLNRDKLNGLQDGQPIAPLAHHLAIPNTGMPSVDRTLDKTLTTTGDVVVFLPQAAGTTASDMFRDSLLGGMGTFLASSMGTGIATVVKKEFTKTNAAATTLFLTLAGSFIGGGVGFVQSAVENVRDLKNLLVGPRL